MVADTAHAVAAVELRGVSKLFGEHEVLSRIDLSVAAGETVCILGPSGSGKTTLLRCINWLEIPDSGAIFLRGTRIGMISAVERIDRTAGGGTTAGGSTGRAGGVCATGTSPAGRGTTRRVPQ